MKTLLLVSTMLLSVSSFAAPTMMDVTTEQRKQMADMHMHAAECLNSTKSMQECRDEMMKNAPHMARGMGEKWGCPMMGNVSQPEAKSKTTK